MLSSTLVAESVSSKVDCSLKASDPVRVSFWFDLILVLKDFFSCLVLSIMGLEKFEIEEMKLDIYRVHCFYCDSSWYWRSSFVMLYVVLISNTVSPRSETECIRDLSASNRT